MARSAAASTLATTGIDIKDPLSRKLTADMMTSLLVLARSAGTRRVAR
jgi:hypothetical protein